MGNQESVRREADKMTSIICQVALPVGRVATCEA